MPTATAPVDPFVEHLLHGLILFVWAADLLIVVLLAVGFVRGRPILAPRWSVADILLALQAALGLMLLGMVPGTMDTVLLGGMRADAANPYTPMLLGFAILPALLAQEVGFVAVPVGLVYLRYRGTLADLGWPARWREAWRPFLGGAALTILVIPISSVLETAVDRGLLQSGRLPHAAALRQLSQDMNALALFDPLRHHPLLLLGFGIIVAVIGPIAEEVFFRGFAFRILKQRFGRIAGLVLSALLFAMLHGNVSGFLALAFMGLILALMYERTGTLAAGIGLHCTNNLVALLAYLWSPTFDPLHRLFGK